MISIVIALHGAIALQDRATVAEGRTTAAVTSTPVEADYRLGTSDKIRLIVFGEPTLSGEFAVNAGGMLSVPLIGDVAADGRTAAEVRKTIEDRLADGYLRNPRVNIDILTYRPFFILGEVNKPGEYPFSSGLTVLNAVATAQGFTYRANKKRVFIRHRGDGRETEVKLEAATAVAPGDTVRIGERYF